MSGTVAIGTAGRPAVSRGWKTGIIVGIASFVIFTMAAERLASHGLNANSVLPVWQNPTPETIGGRWLACALLWLIQLLIGSTMDTLVIVTIVSASFFQGLIAHDLVKRGWTPLQASLAVGLNALHPVMLALATSGSPLLLYVMVAGAAIIALDRFEAIGDTQSIIMLGLLLAALSLSWPNAVFFIVPLTALLPWAFKDILNYNAATALFIVALTPALICLSAVSLGGILFHQSFNDMVSVWASPLHGAADSVIQNSNWLAMYGGRPIPALIMLSLWCLVLLPCHVIIILRFLFSRHERARPVTGIAALFLPCVTGMLATMYFQMESVWVALALSMTCAIAWSTTVNFRKWEKWGWVASTGLGVIISWLAPVLWSSPEQFLWRSILFAG